MDKEYFAQKLVEQFPEFLEVYKEHLENFEELLGHIFFGGETFLRVLPPLLRANKDKETIRCYMEFVKDMYANGDDDVQNIVGVTIIESLGDDEIILRNAFSYFSEDLMLAAQSLEKGMGRRDIHIWHKNGKVQYDWKWPRQL